MSDDDKGKKDQTAGDGTGLETGKSGTTTTLGFTELLGHIDERIAAALGKRGSSNDASKGDAGSTGSADPQSVREQLRAELAKLQGEEAAAKKDADRDVTIEELKTQVAKLTEEKPEEHVSWLTEKMWGKRTKKA